MESESKSEQDNGENNRTSIVRWRRITESDQSSGLLKYNMEFEFNPPTTSGKHIKTPETTKKTCTGFNQKRSSSLKKGAPVTKKLIFSHAKKKTATESKRLEAKTPPAPTAVTIGGLLDSHHVDYSEMLKEMLAEEIIANSVIESSLNIKAPEKKILEKVDDGLERFEDLLCYPSTSASISNFACLEYGGNAIPESTSNTQSNVETSEGNLLNKSKLEKSQNECVFNISPSTSVQNSEHFNVAGTRNFSKRQEPNTQLNHFANSTSTTTSIPSSMPTFRFPKFGGPVELNRGNGFSAWDENDGTSSLNRPMNGAATESGMNFLIPGRSVIQPINTTQNICEMMTSVNNEEVFANGTGGVPPMNTLDGEEDGIMEYVQSLNLDLEEEERECQMRIQRVTEMRDRTMQSIRTAIDDQIQQNRNADAIEISDDDMLDSSTQYISSENLSDAGSDVSVEFVGRYVPDVNNGRNNIPSTSRGRHRKSRMDKILHTSEHGKKDPELPKEESLVDSPKVKKECVLSDCAICLDPLNPIDLSSTFCGHVFCTSCIKSVIKVYRRCPICRSHLNSKKVHPIFLL